MHNVLYISKKINKIVSQSNFIWVSNSTLIESLSSSKIDVLFHSEFPGGTHVVYLSFGAPYPAISILFYLFKWVVIWLRKISVQKRPFKETKMCQFNLWRFHAWPIYDDELSMGSHVWIFTYWRKNQIHLHCFTC